MTETRGFLFVATGEAYVAEARRAIARLRASGNTQPVALCCDGAVPEGEADIVLPITREIHGNFDKIRGMAATPFDRTVFLDTDAVVLAEIGELFDLLDGYDIAAAHAPAYPGFAEPDVPEAFFELNTGVIAYRRSERMAAFFAAWGAEYRRGLQQQRGTMPPTADQPSFRTTVWRQRMALYALPPEYNFRPGFASFLRGRAKIAHGRMHDMDAVVAAIHQKPGPRVFGAFRRAGAQEAEWGLPIGGFATLGRRGDGAG